VTEIVGSKGRITYPTFQHTPILLESDGMIDRFEIPHPDHIQQPLIQTIVDELRGTGTCPSTGRTGAMTNRVMDKVLGRLF